MKIEDFELISPLGKGAYGEVVKALHKETQKHYAIKFINKQFMLHQKKTFAVFREKEIMALLKDSKHSINLKHSFQDNLHIYLVMELIEGITLLEYTQSYGKMDHSFVHHIISELIEYLAYTKRFGVFHGDLKPENVMVTADFGIKVIDYGCAGISQVNSENAELDKKFKKFCDDNGILSQFEFVGSSAFVSPEHLDESVSHWSGDLWALGVLMYYLLTCKLLFDDKTEYLVFQRIINCDYKLEAEELTEMEKIFMSSILVKDPKSRLGYRTISDLRDHDYIKQTFKKLYSSPIAGPKQENQSSSLEVRRSLKFGLGITEDGYDLRMVIIEDKLVKRNWIIFPRINYLVLERNRRLKVYDEDKINVLENYKIKNVYKVRKESPSVLKIYLSGGGERSFELTEARAADWVEAMIDVRKKRRWRVSKFE